jgi:hypothetical protein
MLSVLAGWELTLQNEALWDDLQSFALDQAGFEANMRAFLNAQDSGSGSNVLSVIAIVCSTFPLMCVSRCPAPN